MSGVTPYLGIRYPLSSEIISAAAEQAMATDMDVELAQADSLADFALGRPSAQVNAGAGLSLVKNTLTTVTWASSNSGTFWNATNPTRITVQNAGLYVIQTSQELTGLSAGNVSTFRVMVAKNGATAQPNIQSQMTPQFQTGQFGANLFTVWLAAAGDFFEVKVLWNGAAAGPFSTVGSSRATIFAWALS